jgi:hypothetical protein
MRGEFRISNLKRCGAPGQSATAPPTSADNREVFGQAPPNTPLHRHAIERVRSSSKIVPNSWSNSQITIGVRRRSTLRFRFFEAEEVNVAAVVAGDDKLEGIGKCVAICDANLRHQAGHTHSFVLSNSGSGRSTVCPFRAFSPQSRSSLTLFSLIPVFLARTQVSYIIVPFSSRPEQ